MNTLQTIFLIVVWLSILKSIMVGSDYSFYHKFKYGKKYSDWYHGRETFKEFLEKENRNS